jgi:hypothetical protein
MTPFEFQDTIDDIREAQRITALQLSGFLRGRSDAARARLEDARAREAELFRIVLAGLDLGARRTDRPRKDQYEPSSQLDS